MNDTLFLTACQLTPLVINLKLFQHHGKEEFSVSDLFQALEFHNFAMIAQSHCD